MPQPCRLEIGDTAQRHVVPYCPKTPAGWPVYSDDAPNWIFLFVSQRREGRAAEKQKARAGRWPRSINRPPRWGFTICWSDRSGHQLPFRRSNARFPLTPTLSLGERENHFPPLGRAEALPVVERARSSAPLPKGEGWGEREARVREPQRCSRQKYIRLLALDLPATRVTLEP